MFHFFLDFDEMIIICFVIQKTGQFLKSKILFLKLDKKLIIIRFPPVAVAIRCPDDVVA